MNAPAARKIKRTQLGGPFGTQSVNIPGRGPDPALGRTLEASDAEAGLSPALYSTARGRIRPLPSGKKDKGTDIAAEHTSAVYSLFLHLIRLTSPGKTHCTTRPIAAAASSKGYGRARPPGCAKGYSYCKVTHKIYTAYIYGYTSSILHPPVYHCNTFLILCLLI